MAPPQQNSRRNQQQTGSGRPISRSGRTNLPPSRPLDSVLDGIAQSNRSSAQSTLQHRSRDYQTKQQTSTPADPVSILMKRLAETLHKLSFNCKPLIDHVTEIAAEAARLGAFRPVKDVLLKHLMACPVGWKLPALYAIDSVLKNVGEPYRTAFLSSNVVDGKAVNIFTAWTTVVDQENLAPEMILPELILVDFGRVLVTWRALFPTKIIEELEKTLPKSALNIAESTINAPLARPPVEQPSAKDLPASTVLLEMLQNAIDAVQKDPPKHLPIQAPRIRNLFAHLRLKGDLEVQRIDAIENKMREGAFDTAYDMVVGAGMSLVLGSGILESLRQDTLINPSPTKQIDADVGQESLDELFDYKRITQTVPDKDAHHPLYSQPHQCTNCGIRFAIDQKAALQAHLDAHFRKNIRARERHGRNVQVRGWNLNREGWLLYGLEKTINALPNVQHQESTAIFKEEKANDQLSKDEEEVKVLPVDESEALSTKCGACLESFKTRWDDRSGQWLLVDAVREGSAVYHSACLALKNK